MIVVFCSSPLNLRDVDEEYRAECEAAGRVGLDAYLFSYEALVYGRDPDGAVSRVPGMVEETAAVYRGWMLTPEQYRQLYEALLRKRVRLITSPEEYRFCHYLPESYPLIREMTPETAWVPVDTPEFLSAVREQLSRFGGRPVVIKDYVKSRKHEWEEACFIPNASDTEHAMRVVQRFLELQGEDLQGGLVIREYVELAYLTRHSKSGMPLSLEYRVFFLYGKAIAILPYWEEGEYDVEPPDLAPFIDVAQRVASPFFTMDLAKRQDDGWIIVELGDGQVSGLPEHADVERFYESLRQ